MASSDIRGVVTGCYHRAPSVLQQWRSVQACGDDESYNLENNRGPQKPWLKKQSAWGGEKRSWAVCCAGSLSATILSVYNTPGKKIFDFKLDKIEHIELYNPPQWLKLSEEE